MPNQSKTHKTQEELHERERLRAMARYLARKEIQLRKTPRFQKGKLVENKAYKTLETNVENIRSRVRENYNRLMIAY